MKAALSKSVDSLDPFQGKLGEYFNVLADSAKESEDDFGLRWSRYPLRDVSPTWQLIRRTVKLVGVN